MRKLLLTFACLVLASPRVVAAQAIIAYFTLIETPPGALPPVLARGIVRPIGDLPPRDFAWRGSVVMLNASST